VLTAEFAWLWSIIVMGPARKRVKTDGLAPSLEEAKADFVLQYARGGRVETLLVKEQVDEPATTKKVIHFAEVPICSVPRSFRRPRGGHARQRFVRNDELGSERRAVELASPA
jgi:hypothetical protein